MLKTALFRGALIVGSVLLFAGTSVQGKGFSPPGPLPMNKSKLQACRDGVLNLGHGSIERLRGHERNGVYYYVFGTRELDGTEWLIACDSTDGRIVKAVGLDGI